MVFSPVEDEFLAKKFLEKQFRCWNSKLICSSAQSTSSFNFLFHLKLEWFQPKQSLNYINMMCGSVSFAQKQHVECPRDTSLLLYFEYISEPVIFHFYLSKEVESVLLLY